MKPYPLYFKLEVALTLLLALYVLHQFKEIVAIGSFDYGGNKTDHVALLAIKSQLIDEPEGVLSSWNHSLPHCLWEGVTCGLKHNRVIELELLEKGLGGTLSPFIGNLSFLRSIRLSNNRIGGEIPAEIGRLFRLSSLKLYNNRFTGEIPVNISRCTNLQNLSLAINKLHGELPMEIGTLANLKVIFLEYNQLSGPLFKVIANLTSLEFLAASNNVFSGTMPDNILMMRNLSILDFSCNELTGKIPPYISNFSFLQELHVTDNQLEGELPMELGKLHRLNYLNLRNNKFSGPLFKVIENLTSLEIIDCQYNSFTGSIPDSISRMTNLIALDLGQNNISGKLPPPIFNLSSLQDIYLSYNQLRGNIPSNTPFTLSKLHNVVLGENKFSGTIPISLLNLTTLQRIDLQQNRFTGNIQYFNFGQLYDLQVLQIGYNNFVGDINIINTLMNSSKLEVLQFTGNQFTGIIPKSLANLSITLTHLKIGHNPMSGEIPSRMSNLINLETLGIMDSGLIGAIPQDIGKLQKLQTISIGYNKLKGQIPDSFGNLSLLTSLYLDDNKLEGRIPPNLGNCASLLYLNLAENDFNGFIPIKLFGGSAKFIYLNISHNQLQGSLPLEISKQFKLIVFGVSGNKLSGKFPGGFGSLLSLQYLDMHDNFFQGSIPSSFTALKSLLVIDLSQNNLSGPLPEYFSTFPLIYLNLSYNNFEGKVPTKGVFVNTSAIFLGGNNRLCGGVPELHLQRCIDRERQNRMLKFGVPIICALVGTLFMVIFIWLYLASYCKKRKPILSTMQHEEGPFMKVSYDALLKATNAFSAENLIGSGCFGSVFKGILDGITVAVKVFNLEVRGGCKSFNTECEALQKIRHRNLVGIITTCSSIDYQGNEFKALVYEFMQNGSLEAWLHGGQDLSLLQRLDVAIDVGHALNYLHQECGYCIVHCDIKPSNILLDEDLVSHVGDFGLVKVFGQTLHLNQSSSIGVKGTIGYIAPEYGLGGEATVEADLYSYGILLLELMTRKRPTDNMFREDLNLHKYAEAAFPDKVLNIVDSTLLEIDGEEIENTIQRIKPVIEVVVKIGVACSNAMQHQRMQVSAAIKELQQARDFLLKIYPNI